MNRMAAVLAAVLGAGLALAAMTVEVDPRNPGVDTPASKASPGGSAAAM